MPLPLPTLLSQALAAFTIELDNVFEQRMPNVTKATGAANGGDGISRWGYAPWCASYVMYANFLRFVDEAGTPARQVQQQARITPRGLQVCLSGMSRWRYVRVAPDPSDKRPRPPKGDWLVTPTNAGRQSQAVWGPLAAEIEDRWATRLGAEAVSALRHRLTAVLRADGRPLPDYLPIVGWGMVAEGTPRGAADRPDADNLCALLARTLLAFTLDYEAQGGVSLMIAANLLRLMTAGGVKTADLPRLAGVSKEAISMGLSALTGTGLAVVGADITVARTKLAGLTDKGLEAKADYERRLAEVETAWCTRFGDETIAALRAALEPIVGGPGLDASPLTAGLDPPLTGWRARFPRPTVLPHHPMILHRGGYPDGA